jgi:hypothetical protein
MNRGTYIFLLHLPFLAAFISIYNPAIFQWDLYWALGSGIYILTLRMLGYRYLGLSWKQSFGIYLFGTLSKQYTKVWQEELLLGLVLLGVFVLFLLTLI